MRYRRIAQCRQVDAVQRADGDGGGAGGELSVLHHRAECRRGRGARSAARQARRDRQVRPDHSDAADLRRYRRPGARRLEGRGPRQPVPRHHPRGRCGRPCGALLRGFRHHPCRGQDRAAGRHRDHRDRADARRSRQPGEARRQPRQEGQGQRQGRQGAARPRQPRAGAAARGQAGAVSRAQARGGARLRHARPVDLEAGALRLQCRGRLRPPTGNKFSRSRRRTRQEGRRGRGDHLRQDRIGDRDAVARGARANSSTRWAWRRPASTA